MDILSLAIVGILVFFALWNYPELGIGLYLFNGVFKTAPIFQRIDPIIPTAFILGVTTMTFILRKPKRINKIISLDSILAFILLFNILVLFSAFNTSHYTDKAFRLVFFSIASFMLAFLTAQYPKRLIRAFQLFAFLAFLAAISSILLFMFNGDLTKIRSLTLFASNDVIYGRTIGLGVAIMIGLLFFQKKLSPFWQCFLLIALPITFINLILSTSRGGLVGVIGSVFIMGLVHFKSIPKWFWLLLLVAGFGFSLIISNFGSQIAGLHGFSVLFGGELDRSSLERLIMYQIALEQFLAYPLFGIGILSNAYYPHNIILEIASELGLIGLGIFSLLTLFVLLKIKYLLSITTDIHVYILANLIFTGLIYSAIIVQFSANLQMQRELWMFIALCWALDKKNNFVLSFDKKLTYNNVG